MVADVALSWVAAGTSIADWVTWSLICLISIVNIEFTILTLPELITAAVSEFIVVLMCSTFVGMSMSMIKIIGQVTVISIETVVTCTVSPCIHIGIVTA